MLITAITALNKSDTTRALKVLEERLMQLARRSKRPQSRPFLRRLDNSLHLLLRLRPAISGAASGRGSESTGL